MQLNRQEFDARYANGTLHIAFIGMSNIGKSYTASRLKAAYDFDLIEVDSLIWEKLGHNSMDELAKWQGQPYEPGYAEREARSLALETQATLDAVHQATRANPAANTLIDTAGSVIYTDPLALKALRAQCFIVHINANAEDIERLKSDYFTNPKPLVWAGHFKAQDGLSDQENILASYPDLLAARAKRYTELADATLESRFILDPGITAERIFDALRPSF